MIQTLLGYRHPDHEDIRTKTTSPPPCYLKTCCEFTPKQTNSDYVEPEARRLTSGEKPSQRCTFPPRHLPIAVCPSRYRGLPIPPPTTGLR
jgi:hypothetical protein